ncbi:uncharacterized protein [Drosophila kikkawai]|uniref:Uncharacterized protein n=1 Tax=Drosophila kikkawai TaxID=30033 RepID=A0A6P4IPG2_DROKI|nr:uncharacterized protein LOC108076855 [Drosophila kikkawai]KAH8308455.1 hypothetical protein KR059_012993 [Drosophila kikkawai]
MDRAPWKILILLQIIGLTLSSREYVLDSENIFTECLNPPPGSKPFNHLVDISRFTTKKDKDGIHISGNLTTTWDIGPTDRIEINVAILKLDRGNWKPTALAVNVKDFCKEMYDTNTLYYPYSIKYISNKQDVKDKCFNHKGTLILVDPFVLKVVLSVAVPLGPGPHRVVVKLVAYNTDGVPNPTSICMEVPGKVV